MYNLAFIANPTKVQTMKHFLSASLLVCISLLRLPAQEALTIYSHRHYAADEALFRTFTEKTGIAIHVVKAGADELLERLKAEGANSPADLFITADAGRLAAAKDAGLLQPVDSARLTERIPEAYRDPDSQWFGFTLRARVLIYAPDRVKEGELRDYESLADPLWKGRILSRSSSNIYSQSLMASMIAHHGEEKAQAWARAVRANFARPPQGSDRDQIRAVAAGLGDVAIANTYYLGIMMESPDPKDREIAAKVKVFHPNQDGRGVHVNISGAGVTKTSRNLAAATRFLEFLASDEAQASFPQATQEYPVVKDIPLSDIQKNWGTFKIDSLNLAKLGELNASAVRLFNLAGWE